MPPDVPADRVAALRKAFNDMIVDPEFLAQAAKARMDLRTATGQHMEVMVKNVLTASPEVIKRLTDLMVQNGSARCEDYTDTTFCSKGGEDK
jgi:tripartite-type tricarboxylate transporter receptor subunit TctC